MRRICMTRTHVRTLFLPLNARRLAAYFCVCLALLITFAATGCSHEHRGEVTRVSDPPTVNVLKPEERNITRVVGQPSFVEAYERTAIYPKLSAYIEKWYVDIGDKVTKGQVLCDLFVPEVKEDCLTKKAKVELDKQRVELAKKTVLVADADVRSAEAHLRAAKAIWSQYQAQVVRWDSEVKRLTREVERGVVDPQVLLESENQLAPARPRAKRRKPTSPRRVPTWNRSRPRCTRTRWPLPSPRPTSRSPPVIGNAWKPGWVT